MSQVISLRLSDATAERLRQFARRSRRSMNEVGATSIEEWLRQNEFSFIEFRTDSSGERHTCLKGRLPIWQLIRVARSFDMDAGQTAQHLSLPLEQVQAGLAYYEAYPEEIDLALEANSQGFDHLRRLLPNLERIEVPAEYKGNAEGNAPK